MEPTYPIAERSARIPSVPNGISRVSTARSLSNGQVIKGHCTESATTTILSWTKSLHLSFPMNSCLRQKKTWFRLIFWRRSEEHTSELQSRENLVCRLLLEKKKNIYMGLLA